MLTDFGFTGTQIGLANNQRRRLSNLYLIFHDILDTKWQHNGSCIGADAESAFIWHDELRLGNIHLHPPINTYKMAKIPFEKSEKPKEYIQRNHEIVNSSDLLVACPSDVEQLRSGTWATVRYARKMSKPIIIVWPDGTLSKENNTILELNYVN